MATLSACSMYVILTSGYTVVKVTMTYSLIVFSFFTDKIPTSKCSEYRQSVVCGKHVTLLLSTFLLRELECRETRGQATVLCTGV